MRKDADDVAVLATNSLVEKLFGRIPVRSDSLHSGINFQVNSQTLPGCAGRGLGGVELVNRRGSKINSIVEKVLELGIEQTSKHKNMGLDSMKPEFNCFLNVGYAKILCAL